MDRERLPSVKDLLTSVSQQDATRYSNELELRGLDSNIREGNLDSLYWRDIKRYPNYGHWLKENEVYSRLKVILLGEEAEKILRQEKRNVDDNDLRELKLKVETGKTTFQDLAIRYASLVPIVAERFFGKGVASEELINAGNLGLCEAIRNGARKYDPRIAKFNTYADSYILKRVSECYEEIMAEIYVRRLSYVSLTITKYIDKYWVTHGVKPSIEEITLMTGNKFTEAEVSIAMKYLDFGNQVLPLDAMSEDGDGINPESLLVDDTDIYRRGLVEPESYNIQEIFEYLVLAGKIDPRSEKIIRLLFGLNNYTRPSNTPPESSRSQDEALIRRRWKKHLQNGSSNLGQERYIGDITMVQIGKKLGLTNERVRQLRQEALNVIRQELESRYPNSKFVY